MRRNANGARDFFAPVEISEEVLAEVLASMREQCSKRRAKRGESQRSRR